MAKVHFSRLNLKKIDKVIRMIKLIIFFLILDLKKYKLINNITKSEFFKQIISIIINIHKKLKC